MVGECCGEIVCVYVCVCVHVMAGLCTGLAQVRSAQGGSSRGRVGVNSDDHAQLRGGQLPRLWICPAGDKSFSEVFRPPPIKWMSDICGSM